MNIYLIGFRACGKTSAGKMFAAKTETAFIDTDLKIVKKENLSIAEIVSKRGWPYFRKLEKNLIKEISLQKNLIVSTGGGAILSDQNITQMRKNVWMLE